LVEAAESALAALYQASRQRGLVVIEVLLPPADVRLPDVLSRAGFRHITRLIYLQRECSAAPQAGPHCCLSSKDLTWDSYRSDTHRLFCEAVEASYVQSLDCPELGGLRKTDDVLAGHRAAGDFDPGFWWVASRGGVPVGVLLMNCFSSTGLAEIVYMGVAQPARGTGVADALLDQAERLAGGAGVKQLALAVDARNIPARRVYTRWRFTETGAREAWIATPCISTD
jgi:GNAT superfamily N-acetyltransferase